MRIEIKERKNKTVEISSV